jgi:hypothetical protein
VVFPASITNYDHQAYPRQGRTRVDPEVAATGTSSWPRRHLQLDSEGEQITLRPVRPKALLKKERGVWVYQGEPTGASVTALIDRERDKRLRELIE